MRRWYMPLTVMGVGALGVLAVAVGGGPARQWLLQKLKRAPEAFLEWNDAAQQELNRLQSALDGLSAQLSQDETSSGRLPAT